MIIQLFVSQRLKRQLILVSMFVFTFTQFLITPGVRRLQLKDSIEQLLKKYEYQTNPMRETQDLLKDNFFSEKLFKSLKKIALPSHNTLLGLINHCNIMKQKSLSVKELEPSSKYNTRKDLVEELILKITELMGMLQLAVSLVSGNILGVIQSIIVLGTCIFTEFLHWEQIERLERKKKELTIYFSHQFPHDVKKFMKAVSEWIKAVYLFFLFLHIICVEHEIIFTLLLQEDKVRKHKRINRTQIKDLIDIIQKSRISSQQLKEIQRIYENSLNLTEPNQILKITKAMIGYTRSQNLLKRSENIMEKLENYSQIMKKSEENIMNLNDIIKQLGMKFQQREKSPEEGKKIIDQSIRDSLEEECKRKFSEEGQSEFKTAEIISYYTEEFYEGQHKVTSINGYDLKTLKQYTRKIENFQGNLQEYNYFCIGEPAEEKQKERWRNQQEALFERFLHQKSSSYQQKYGVNSDYLKKHHKILQLYKKITVRQEKINHQQLPIIHLLKGIHIKLIIDQKVIIDQIQEEQ